MARNAEKAQSMLARFREAQAIELGLKTKTPIKRPFDPSRTHTVRAAERWRTNCIREISKKVSMIQNPALSEYQIRDLNDDINKLLEEKTKWQSRILELGGPNYFKTAPVADHDGKEVPGNKGYKYFGRAKDLPGVRELFEQAATEAPRKTRHELQLYVDADYYGYRDDEDGIIIPLEQEAEKQAIATAIAEASSGKRKRKANDDEIAEKKQEELDALKPANIPTQKQVEEYLLDRRKRELLDKYVSPDLMQQIQQSKPL